MAVFQSLYLSALKFEFHRIFMCHEVFLWWFFQPSKNVKPFLCSQPLRKHGSRDLARDPQLTEHWHKLCMFFLSLGPPFLPQIHLLTSLHLSFTLTSMLSTPFGSGLFDLPFAPKLLGMVHGVWLSVAQLSVLLMMFSSVPYLSFLSLSYASQADCIFQEGGQSWHFMSPCVS